MQETKQHETILLENVVKEIKNFLPDDYSDAAKAENYSKFQYAVMKHSKSQCSKCKAYSKMDLAALYMKALKRITNN